MSDAPIFDIHCHPALKIYLCDRNISDKHYPIPDILPTGMHVDLPGMQNADVRVIFCNHYVPEAGFGHLRKSHFLFELLRKSGLHIMDKFEPDYDGEGGYQRAVTSMSLLDHQVTRAQKLFNVCIPKNLSEFELAFADGKICVLHCLEGGHHLGRNLADDKIYLRNLEHHRKRGLCMITISHFFQNNICDSGGGIPPNESQMIGYAKPPSSSNGLTKVGKSVVEWCQDNGVIIDLVHSTVETRKQIYKILEDRMTAGKKVRPPVFSHTGVRERAQGNMKNPNDIVILPDEEEIRIIQKFRGTLGMILMNYWQNGIEEDDPLRRDRGIEHILSAIEFISKCTGGFENISIGSDLDGFTQVPDDLTHVRLLGRLRDAIRERFGEEEMKRVCFENALRVLREGWS